MEKPKDPQFYHAYILGYRDGVRDALSGKDVHNIHSDIRKLPIEAMEISTRACNCLVRAKYHSVEDILNLDACAIRIIRNLGPKSAKQIAQWLADHGFYYSAWSEYLE